MAEDKPEWVKLGELVAEHAVRIDAEEPDSADVGFFHVLQKPGSDLTALKLKNAIVRAEKGSFMDISLADLTGPESGTSYTTLGAWIGDQGLALALMGLGKILGLWEIVLPSTAGIYDQDLAQRMIGMGFVLIVPGPDSILRA